jgi:hypothetical protein
MRGATVVAVALLLGACGPDDAHPRASTASPDATTTSATAAPGASARLRAARAARGYVAAAAPTGIDAPSIGLHVDGLVPLDRLADGTIAVPPFGQAGWWVQGPKPGQRGPAVLLGHVDTKRGPDVFYRLRDLRPGDPVSVRRADGSVVRFTVQRVAQFPKVAFPSAAVYAPSLEPVLRLVTCGGSFDRTVGHYRDNVIAFATLASP